MTEVLTRGTPTDADERHRYEGRRVVPRHWWPWLVALGLGLAGAWFVTRQIVGPEVVVYPVIRADLVRTIVATGHVETPFRVSIGSQVAGVVDEVLVDEGQSVKEGQPLIALEPSELKAAATEAEGAVAEAEARMRQIQEFSLPAAEENLKQAQATLAVAETSMRRAKALYDTGAGTKAILEEATKSAEVARTQVRSAELQVFTQRNGGSDYEMARTRLDQAKANLATARVRLGYATIRAPRDGMLIARSVERGTVVAPGSRLLVLAPSGDTQLVFQLDEKNLGMLRLGQPALASADAYPSDRFEATVSYINPAVDITRASVEVKLTVAHPPDYLRQDMTVSVDVAVDRRAATLIVPAKVVHDATSAAPFVLTVRGGRAQKQVVTLGLRVGDTIEILNGVSKGDVLVPVGAGVRVGQRIRAVRS